jgi:type IV pilus assembly protein PilE
MLGDEGQVVADGDEDRIYGLALTNPTATSYTITATPQLKQAENDTLCGDLTLTNAGTKGQSGYGDNCW